MNRDKMALLRNLYGFELDAKRMADLDAGYPEVNDAVLSELDAFTAWLESEARL